MKHHHLLRLLALCLLLLAYVSPLRAAAEPRVDAVDACRDAWSHSVAQFGCRGTIATVNGQCVVRRPICRAKLNLSFPEPGPREVYATRVPDFRAALSDFSEVRLCIYFSARVYTPRYALRLVCAPGETAPWSGWYR